jgi:uncharacterized protein (TIGR02757 family)
MKKLKALTKPKLLALKPWLDAICDEVEVPEYIASDPVSFLYAFDRKEDRLLAGFFAAIMAWGRRDIVLAKVADLLSRMDHQPEDFIRGFDEQKAAQLTGFRHRTFTAADVYWLISALQQALRIHGDFESFWSYCYTRAATEKSHLMDVFHQSFFELIPECPARTRKHIADRRKKSSCKRLYLFLRWTLRKNSVVDTGLMSFMPVSELMIPLDVHVARQARKLGLLTRTQNDWAAVAELTDRLRIIDPLDPSRYDYALFGIGVMKQEIPSGYILNPHIDTPVSEKPSMD